ncbi:hypothetical protein ABE130_13615, partial [Brevibacillus parabrevis]|uniref:hypothetical protein n=1 Tax=Brevibacillus parabrevis TaxID=54914 RepID=UPI003D20D1BA
QSWQIINDRLINAFAVQFSKSIFSSAKLAGTQSYHIHIFESSVFSKRFSHATLFSFPTTEIYSNTLDNPESTLKFF